jgi:CRISPR-associated endonuclease/helicase Cas3
VASAQPGCRIWAKTDRTSQPHAFHPLICHLLDVAAVTCEMWERVLPEAIHAGVMEQLGIGDNRVARDTLAFWAGVHDIGKASPGFQGLDTEGKERLRKAGLRFPPRACRRHGVLTADVLTRYYLNEANDAGIVRALAAAASGHHGSFPLSHELLDLGSRDRGDSRWEEVRRTLIQQFSAALAISDPVPRTLSPRDHRFFMFLSGLTSVADWIGSAEQWFSFEPYPDDLSAYFAEARRKAAHAIDEIGWTRWQPSTREIDFSDFFGFTPNAMQEQVLALDASGEPELVIIEAPMGEGKTEAALHLVDRWNRGVAERGCYVAMPTQATANAMFDRFHGDYLAKRYPDQFVDLQLVHGHAALSEAYQQLRSLGQVWDQDHDEATPRGAVVAGEWFGYRKRGLLGPFGVGTIDQALLAAMQASHSFVRLFGLAGKTVIFDEVHAFDTYTSDLLDRLLKWLGALGCPVVILSATLPPTRRRKLLEAYAGDVEVPEVHYPRVTRVSPDGADTATWDTEEKRVELGWINPDPTGLAERLSETLDGGGCAAVICNTVVAAQDTFSGLDELLPDAIERHLFHARFPFDERDRREKQTIERFGRRQANRPERAVLVATQVIEQSLDLDFDLMISEVAPVDLLLQRSGRMHRHDRERPPGLECSRLLLMTPEENDRGVPQFGNSGLIYGDYLLLKTWLALRERDGFRIPGDVEDLICAVYEAEPEVEDGALAEALDEARQEAAQRRQRLEHEAALRQLPPPDLEEDFHALPGKLELAEDNPELHNAYRALTRWEEQPSVEIVCLETVDGQPHVRRGEESLPLDLDAEPSEELTEALVRRSVRISDRRINQMPPTPSAWRRTSLLRHHRPVLFDETGRFLGDGFVLRNDPDIGIVRE